MGQVAVNVDQRGLHIEIMDTPTASMFQSGSAKVLDGAMSELQGIASRLRKLPNPIDIEGHTDAKPFSQTAVKNYDNWDLAVDRANAARRVLESAGIQNWQIARVIGYASQRLKVPDDPFHPSNRRISISMRYTELAAKALKGTETVETKKKRIGEKPTPVKPKPKPKAKPKKSKFERDLEKDLVPAGFGEVPDASAKAVPVEQPESGLAVEVGIHLPQGTVIEQPDDRPTRPSWMEKDKIFGDDNSFFKK